MNRSYIFLVCAVAFVFASCVRDELFDDGHLDKGTGMNSITATTAVSTKTMTYDGVNILWENKDALVLRYQSDDQTVPVSCTYTTALAAPETTAVFKKNSDVENLPNKVDGKYIAVYPASVHYLAWAKKPNVILAFNSEQVARDQGFDPSSSIMLAASEDSEFAFKHVVSYIRFSVSAGATPFNKVMVTSGDESQFMVSRIKVNFDDELSYSLEPLNSSGNINKHTKNYVSLTTADNADFAPGTYYLAINPDNYAKGLKFTFENTEGKSVTLSYENTLKMKPGYVLDIGTVNILADLVSLPYISVYKENGRKLGVVFYEDSEDARKKKVVSAACDVIEWASANDNWRISSYKQDYDYVHAVITSSDMYKSDPYGFPAVKFCEEMRSNYGGNWHVPSVNELNILFNAYYGKPYDAEVSRGLEYADNVSKAASEYFDGLLETLGGDSMLERSNEYWSCGQNSNGNMQFLNVKKYHNGNDVQTTQRYVRCIRDVDESVQNDEVIYPQTNIGKLLKGGLVSRITDVTWDTTYNVTTGVDFYQMKVLTDADEKQDIYLIRTDPSKGLDFKVTISDETTSSEWYRQKLSVMAANLDTPSNPVYAMINADFCVNEEPIHPRGPVHCNGQILCSTFDIDPNLTQQGLSYVGITDQGKMTIGYRDDYDSVKNTLRECTGAGVVLVKDSEIQSGHGTGRDPRTAIGYTSNDIVWMLAVDGRHGTLGMTYAEMGSIFKGLGCVDAVNLDGGGSTQMLVRDPQTGKISMRNWPSDPTNGAGGQERPRLNAWAIVKK